MNALAFLLVDSGRLLRAAFEKRILQAGLGLTAGEARALIYISGADGSRQLDIAARMGVEPMTLCAYLDRLQALGLVERQQCSEDRRAKRVNLTDLSTEMLGAIRQELRAVAVRATEGMGDEEALRFERALSAFHDNLQACNEELTSQADLHDGK